MEGMNGDEDTPQAHREIIAHWEGMVVPKVTAFTETAIVYAVLEGKLTRARELVGTLGPAERRAFLSQLTQIINMLWGEMG